MRAALILAAAGLVLNAWTLWKPLPAGATKPHCLLRPAVKRYIGGAHGHHIR